MIEITSFIDTYLQALRATFGERVWFAGLQGSYGRGEAGEGSDIDMVVILDTLSPADIYAYNEMLDSLPHRELLCGFLSGKAEICNWDAADLFQFYYDTKPLVGSLDALLPRIDQTAVDRAIKIGACNIYHGCVHNMLYEKSGDILRGLYKGASFVLQAICFRQTGSYVRIQRELAECLSGDDRTVAEIASVLKRGGEVRFREMSEDLFRWAQKHIEE